MFNGKNCVGCCPERQGHHDCPFENGMCIKFSFKKVSRVKHGKHCALPTPQGSYPGTSMPVTQQTMRKGKMVCGGVNPPYAQIMMLLWLPGPSFCWQGPWCRSIFDLTSTANHRDQAQCQEEVGLFAYWAGASEVGGKTAWQGGTVEKNRSNAYRQTNLEECRQTNKQERKRVQGGYLWGNKISTVRWWWSEEELWGVGSSRKTLAIPREVC